MVAEVIRYWAGRERTFRLSLGEIMDLEEALSKQAIGVTFQKLASGQFSVMDVHETVRIGLIGGGESVIEAKRLMGSHFEGQPLTESAGIALDILIGVMTGVEQSDNAEKIEEPQPLKFSEVSQICRVFHMSPQDVRGMRYADYVNMMRGFNASQPDQPIEHISEGEFLDILERFEPRTDI